MITLSCGLTLSDRLVEALREESARCVALDALQSISPFHIIWNDGRPHSRGWMLLPVARDETRADDIFAIDGSALYISSVYHQSLRGRTFDFADGDVVEIAPRLLDLLPAF